MTEQERKMEERRRSSRVAVDLDITLTSEHNFFTGFAENISTGGLFIASKDLAEIGSDLQVRFRLPDGTDVTSRAAVRWIRERGKTDPSVPSGIGVQFLDLDPRCEAAINAFIKGRQPIFFDDD